MTLYNFIRRLHLFATFLLAAFILMYFITGFVMIFEDEFKREQVEVKRIGEKIYDFERISQDSLLQRLRQRFNLRGQYEFRNKDQKTAVNFYHPGTVTEVIVDHATDSVYVTTKKGNLYTTMHHFHRLHGYKGAPYYYAWAFIYDLSALSMILFSLSGLYLWYKAERRRLAGWIVLLTFTSITFMTIGYLMFLS